MFIFDSLLGDLIGLVITLVVLVLAYWKWTYQYWARNNVPFLEPSFPYGNIGPLMQGKEHTAVTMKRIYDEMKTKGWKIGGFFQVLDPSILCLDLDLLKNVMTKDFQHFINRHTCYNEEDDPLSVHIAFLHGSKWKDLRTKLSPAFTTTRLKGIFQTLLDCESHLHKKIEELCISKEVVDIKEIMTRFTTDVIGSAAFGIECKSFDDEDSPFRATGRLREQSAESLKLKRLFAMNFPNLARLFHISLTPQKMIDFYVGLAKDAVEYREKNNYRRNDLLQMLIDLMNNKFVDDSGQTQKGMSITFTELAAQAFLFFLAGFETSSTLMTFTLYELAKHQDIQDRVREEINTILAKHDGKITYEAIHEMKYFNQVIEESLRKHPPEPQTNRRCLKDYQIPGTNTIIKEGSTVIIPMYAIHHDEEYYPDPDKFDPERFSEENKKSRHNFSFLPFGEGPRICLGMRYGLMQAKVGVLSLLKDFKVTVNKKTQEPIKIDPNGFFLSAVGGIWLDIRSL